MVVCSKCGASGSGKFCASCGEPLSSGSASGGRFAAAGPSGGMKEKSAATNVTGSSFGQKTSKVQSYSDRGGATTSGTGAKGAAGGRFVAVGPSGGPKTGSSVNVTGSAYQPPGASTTTSKKRW